MIKTTPKQIGESQMAVIALLNSRLPVKAAYSVSKLARACDVEMQQYNMAREKIFMGAGCTVITTEEVIKGEKKTISNYTHVDSEQLAQCIKDGDELATTPVEINALPLDLEQFGEAELPGSAFYGLEWAMKDAK